MADQTLSTAVSADKSLPLSPEHQELFATIVAWLVENPEVTANMAAMIRAGHHEKLLTIFEQAAKDA